MGDADVIDDDDNGAAAQQATWFSGDWMDKAKFAAQFIFDAIEKRPEN